jgi:hypothetical protein
MKKLLLILMLAVVSSSAMAEWVYFGEDGEGKAKIYVEPTTIRKSSNKVKIWTLFDFKSPLEKSSKGIMSISSQFEFDCKEEQNRVIYEIHYPKNMGKGHMVADFNNPGTWMPNPPHSIHHAVSEFVCGKK